MNKYISSANLIQVAPVAFLFTFMVGMWLLRTEAFISDDSYFYLVISRNLALEGHQTFSGIMSTNGAHPLWLYLLTAYSWLVSALFGPDSLNNPEFALPLSVALLIGGCVAWWKIGDILRIHQPILVLIPLAFITFFGVLYSEVHLLFFTLSLLVMSVIGRNSVGRLRYALIGTMRALVVLSRLDTVFLIGTLGVLLFIWDRDFRGLAMMSLTFVIITIPYLASNYLIFGHLTPVSGYVKSTFPEVFIRGFQTQGGILALSFEGYSIFFGIIPTAFALALWLTYREKWTKLVIAAVLGGAILQFLQIALFTRSHTSWYWYYLLPVTAGALASANLLSPAKRQFLRLSIPLSRASVLVSALLVLTVIIATGTVIHRWNSPLGSSQALAALEFVQNHDDSTYLVSDWPGYPSYFSPSNRIIAADILTGNVSVLEEMKDSGNA
ncbi:MAG: hypothetical protein F4X94_04595 [Dehalococcoidia bacterium]|nr:hypothetical protein [Dehalococcoidia bacterium]